MSENKPLVDYIVNTVLYHYGDEDDLPRWVNRPLFMVDACEVVLKDLMDGVESLRVGFVPDQAPLLVVRLASGRAEKCIVENHTICTLAEREKPLQMTKEVIELVKKVAKEKISLTKLFEARFV